MNSICDILSSYCDYQTSNRPTHLRTMADTIIISSIEVLTGLFFGAAVYYILERIVNSFYTPSVPIISIEGNIGSGKSTLLRYLKKHTDITDWAVFVQEPVEEWRKFQDCDGKNILDHFYQAPELWAFPFQVFAWLTKYRAIKKAQVDAREQGKKCIIMERSHDSDYHIFMKSLHSKKTISDLMFRTYEQFFLWGDSKLTTDHHIYLYCRPSLCHERIAMRGRDEESSITIDYLKELHFYHEAWLRDSPKENMSIIYSEYAGELHSSTYNTFIGMVRSKIIDIMTRQNDLTIEQ